MQIGAAIRRLRDGVLTQDQLAEEMGTQQAQVSRWERGESEPSFEELAVLEDILDRPRGTVLRAVGLVSDPCTAEDAIRGDARLDAEGLRIALGFYATLLSGPAKSARKDVQAHKARRK